MRASRRQRGFTLLEVVLSIALVLGMMGGLLAFQSYALDIRKTLGADARRIAPGRHRGYGVRHTDRHGCAIVQPSAQVGGPDLSRTTGKESSR